MRIGPQNKDMCTSADNSTTKLIFQKCASECNCACARAHIRFLYRCMHSWACVCIHVQTEAHMSLAENLFRGTCNPEKHSFQLVLKRTFSLAPVHDSSCVRWKFPTIKGANLDPNRKALVIRAPTERTLNLWKQPHNDKTLQRRWSECLCEIFLHAQDVERSILLQVLEEGGCLLI